MAVVDPEAKLGDGNIIGPFCVIDKNVVIGDNNKFLNNVTVHFGARIGNGNEFFPGASISTKPQDLKFQGEETTCEIGDNNSIRENVTISRGTASKGKTVVGNGNLLMENMHVAHDCVIGNGCIIGNSTKFAGEVVVDDFAIISATCLFHQFIRVGSYVMFQGGSRTSMDIPPRHCWQGTHPLRWCQPRRSAPQRIPPRDHRCHPRGLSHYLFPRCDERWRGHGSRTVPRFQGGGIYLLLHRELQARRYQITDI